MTQQRNDPDATAEEAVEESFPGSDPPATWAGQDKPAQPAGGDTEEATPEPPD